MFLKINKQLLRSNKLKLGEKILISLIYEFEQNGKDCCKTNNTFARDMDVAESTVEVWLKNLVEGGWITRNS